MNAHYPPNQDRNQNLEQSESVTISNQVQNTNPQLGMGNFQGPLET